MVKMRRIATWVVALVAAGTILAGCSGGSAKPTPVGPALSDDAYLQVICTGLSNFSNALLTKTKPEDLAQVIKDYIASLQGVQPPAGVEQFHQGFIKYLQDSIADPTSLVTKTPPLPTGAVRQRLATAETQTPECKDAKFFTRS
jgi:hypothetical protein